MIIGLVRHFKVAFKSERSWLTSVEFEDWISQYNSADVIPNEMKWVGTNWELCFSSDLIRAERTADLLFPGIVTRLPSLREIGLEPMFRSRIKLHYNLWLLLSRIGWFCCHRSQTESRKHTEARAEQVVTYLESHLQSNILVITHGAFMNALNRELARRGYAARTRMKMKPDNGVLYRYEKTKP
jgi:broad specificity phosphatase PhoE